MKFLKVIRANGQEIPFEMPGLWSECTYLQYIESRLHYEDRLKIYEIFTGIKAEIWGEPHDPALFLAMDRALNFISKEPATTRPEIVSRGGKFYDIPKDFLRINYGKYSDFLTLYSSAGEDEIEIIKKIPQLVAIFCCIDYETQEELEEIGREVEQMQADEVQALASFFLSKLTESKLGTKKTLRKTKRIRPIFLRVTMYFLAGLGLLWLFTTSPGRYHGN